MQKQLKAKGYLFLAGKWNIQADRAAGSTLIFVVARLLEDV